MVLIGIMLALVTAVPMEQYSSRPMDDLGYKLMEVIEAKPAKCPEVLAEDEFLSIMFCGKTEVGFVQNEAAVEQVIAALVERADAEPAAEWVGDERRRSRKYQLLDIPFRIVVDRKSGLVVLSYPAQFPGCIKSDLPKYYPESDGVSLPEKVTQRNLKVEYPEIARQARLEGMVILQAVIKKNGSMGEICPVYVDKPNLGFEEAAIAAVKQWRYEPAMQDGKPLDVVINIHVSFNLH